MRAAGVNVMELKQRAELHFAAHGPLTLTSIESFELLRVFLISLPQVSFVILLLFYYKIH